MKDQNYQNLLENLYEGVFYVDLNRKIKYWSKGAEKITGYTSEEMIGKYCGKTYLAHTTLNNEPLCETGCLFRETLLTGTYRKSEVFLKHKKGHKIHVSVRVSPMYNMEGKIIGATQIFTNNEYYFKHKTANEDESYALYFDRLTKLPSQYSMKLKIKAKIQEFRRYGWKFACFLLEIDNFVEYKRKLDSAKMDELIISISQLVKINLRPFDIISRWQANQFMVLMVNVSEDYLEMLSERLRKSILKKGLPSLKKNVGPSLSIGTSIVTEGISLEELIEKVTKLKNKSVEKGGNCATISC